jgi:hypothetical protein
MTEIILAAGSAATIRPAWTGWRGIIARTPASYDGGGEGQIRRLQSVTTLKIGPAEIWLPIFRKGRRVDLATAIQVNRLAMSCSSAARRKRFDE